MYSHPLLSGHVHPYTLPLLTGNTPLERQTITFYWTDDAVIPWVIYQDSSPQAVQDITGWTFALLFKGSAWDDDAFALVTLPGVIGNASGGAVNFTLRSVQSRLLEGELSYVLRAIDNAGRHRTLAIGAVHGIVS